MYYKTKSLTSQALKKYIYIYTFKWSIDTY